MYKEAVFYTLYKPLKLLCEDHAKADEGSPLYLKLSEEIVTVCKDALETVSLEDISSTLLRAYKDQVDPPLWPEQTEDGWFYTEWTVSAAIPHGPFDTEIEAFEQLLGEKD